MKILLIQFILILGLISCEDSYQNKDLNLSITQTVRDVRDTTTTTNTLSQNMQEYLNKYIVSKDDGTADTLVDYQKLYDEKDAPDTLELRENMFTQIAKADYENLSKNAKAAFLINSYNFFVIETIIANYYKDGNPISSINDIGPAAFWAFGNIPYKIAGDEKTLDQIEKETLKPLLTFKNGSLDARFHFVAICGAKGCPILMQEAYTPEDLDQQLTNATIKGLELKRNLDTSVAGVLRLTELFNWYADDFKSHSEDGTNPTGTIQSFIKKYAPNADTSGKTEYTPYDWNLNILN